MPLTLSPLLADRFTRIMAMLCDIIAHEGARRRFEGRFTVLIHTYVRRLARRFVARATTPPHKREGVPRGPRPTPTPDTAAAPRARPAPPPGAADGTADGTADGPRLPRGQAWLVKLMQPTVVGFGQLRALLAEPEVVALLAARPNLLRILAPLYNAMAYPPEPRIGPPRRPRPAPANPAPKPPRKPRKRKFRFSRREDLLFRLRMGKPIFAD